MAALATPPTLKRTGTSQSPSLKPDGISISKNHLPREDVVQKIYSTAKTEQFVVIGSSAATGKTSLLQLLAEGLKQKSAHVVEISVSDRGIDRLFKKLEDQGIVDDKKKLKELKNTWLLLDDAQNAYANAYAPFWQFIVKTVSSSDVADNLFVVIAATYDFSSPESPVDFRTIEHIKPNISEMEARELFQMHAEQWNFEGWGVFLDTLLQISKFAGGAIYHIGVMMAGIRVLNEKRKEAGQTDFNEEAALAALRDMPFVDNLNRCFKLPNNMVSNFKDRLLSVVLGETQVDVDSDLTLAPFIRAGLLTNKGAFSCMAARWYYNRRCIPNRAQSAPESLEELVKLAVGSISAKRLRDTLVNGFPKEATFQHLFNEAMSLHLPIDHSIIPELNTFATDSDGNPIKGELDFYVNGEKQWCLELLRSGDKIGEHVARFDEHNASTARFP